MEIEVVTPKLNDTERREVQPEENISQINPNTETHNETVRDESFQTPMGGSTRESKNTNNKSRSTKVPAPNVATQQKRDSLVSTSERIEGEEFPNRSAASTSQNVRRTTISDKKCVGNNNTKGTERLFFIQG